MRFYRFDLNDLSQDPRFARFQQARGWAGQPGWVWKFAILTGLLFVVLPLVAIVMVLGLAFALTAGVAFLLFAGAHRLGRFVGGIGRSFQRTDVEGRRNVRVIRREEPPLY